MSDELKKSSSEDLIKDLCSDLKPQGPRCPYRRISIWLLVSIAYIIGVVAYLGLKVNIMEHLTSAPFLFEMIIVTSLLISSALASSWLSFPDCIQRDWMKIVSITLFFSFMMWILANGVEEGMDLKSTFFLSNCSRGLAVEFLPFVALIYLSAKGHTTQPYWSMTMNIIAVSALGWIGLRLTCSMYDSMTYGFVHYLLPFAVLGAGIGFFARKLFKW